MKKLLILAGAEAHCKVLKVAQKMDDIYTIVTDCLPIEDSPAKQMADASLMYDIKDVDSIVEYCKKNHVDGVLNYCIDPGQRPYQQICERLGLPCFGTKEQFMTFTDKNLFKQACVENGIDIIPTYTEDDLLNDKITYPIIVKPVDSRGSRGVIRCSNKNEAVGALAIAKKMSSNGKVVVEKYMGDKPDFTMTYIFVDGKPNLVRTADRYLGEATAGLDRQCMCSVAPSIHTEMYLKNVHSRVVNMAKNLGIKNTPIFMQGFVDGDTVRFYDPGIRFPGANYDELFTKATGVDHIQMIINFALTGKMQPYDEDMMASSYKLNGFCSMQLCVDARAGKIAVYDGFDEVAKLTETVLVAKKAKVGDVISESGDIKQRIAEIVLLLENDTEIIQSTIRKVQSMLKVKDEKGENMIVSPFDVSAVPKRPFL